MSIIGNLHQWSKCQRKQPSRWQVLSNAKARYHLRRYKRNLFSTTWNRSHPVLNMLEFFLALYWPLNKETIANHVFLIVFCIDLCIQSHGSKLASSWTKNIYSILFPSSLISENYQLSSGPFTHVVLQSIAGNVLEKVPPMVSFPFTLFQMTLTLRDHPIRLG